MISQKRIDAARANGALSRGPKTPEGKARSHGALRSRRLADCTVIGAESRSAFHDVLKTHVNHFDPDDEVEMGIVEEMSSAHWRLRRNWAIENQILESAVARQTQGDGLERIAAAHADVAETPQFDRLRRDETRLHVIYQRAVYNLLLVRTLKKRSEPKKSPVCTISSSPVDPNEPSEPKVA